MDNLIQKIEKSKAMWMPVSMSDKKDFKAKDVISDKASQCVNHERVQYQVTVPNVFLTNRGPKYMKSKMEFQGK